MVTAELVRTILQQFALASDGEHGVVHWARVLENGLCLATLTAADPAIIALFAVFHDSRRLTDDVDPLHGVRAADYAASLRGTHFTLSDADFNVAWYVRIPVLLGQLALFSFRLRRIRHAHQIAGLERATARITAATACSRSWSLSSCRLNSGALGPSITRA